MSSNIEIKMFNKSDFNLSFLIDEGETEWYEGEEKKSNDILCKDFKNKIPRRQIFEINSLIYNIINQQKEVLRKYNCFYDERNNSLNIIITEDICFNNFSKDILINLFEFSQKIGIEEIYFLVSKQNSQYIKILKDLMIVGFKVNEKLKNVNIEGNIYKVLVLPIKEDYDEIKEVYF
jgi:hypothetical protein